VEAEQSTSKTFTSDYHSSNDEQMTEDGHVALKPPDPTMEDPGPPPAAHAPGDGTRDAQATGSGRDSKEPEQQQMRSGPTRAATAALMSITKGA
jgi:hypothetical protein